MVLCRYKLLCGLHAIIFLKRQLSKGRGLNGEVLGWIKRAKRK